jgi:hypothetical protein
VVMMMMMMTTLQKEWWEMQTTEPGGPFVTERREDLHYFLKKLFIANPNLFFDPYVQVGPA